MPQVFKALATINAWTLFIVGWLALLRGYASMIGGYVGLDLTPVGAPPNELAVFGGLASLFLSVAVMKLRHMME